MKLFTASQLPKDMSPCVAAFCLMCGREMAEDERRVIIGLPSRDREYAVYENSIPLAVRCSRAANPKCASDLP